MTTDSTQLKPTARLLKLIKDVYSNITIEPIAFLAMVTFFLSYVSSQVLYLEKACRVNLNQSATDCANLTENSALQVQTQEYVAGVQVGIHSAYVKHLTHGIP